MRKWLVSISFLVFFLVVGFLIFSPRSYDVPSLEERAGTRYWDLPTGSKIAYTLLEAEGEPRPYPVIYLHGGPGGFITDLQVKLFGHFAKEGFNIYLYDQVGSGNSERLENIGEYTAARHKLDLQAIVEKIGTKKVILIGQSWGAILATIYAADNPEKVDRLILSCPGPVIPINFKLESLKAPDSLNLKEPAHSNREANSKVRNWRSMTTQFFALRFLKKIASDEEADAFQTTLNHELQKSTVVDSSTPSAMKAGGGYYAQLMTLASFPYTKDPRKTLFDCPIPTLILKGQYDNQLWGYTSEYLSLFSNHTFALIPEAGHSLHRDKPKVYIQEIIQFLMDETE